MAQHRKALSAKELAQALEVNADTIRKHAKEGRIPAMRIGKQFRFDPAAVRLALSNASHQPHTAQGNPRPE